jgi:hypothetical protein
MIRFLIDYLLPISLSLFFLGGIWLLLYIGADREAREVAGIRKKIREHSNQSRKLVCLHQKKHYEDWPDGSAIEICDICGMSRNIWEQGESNWIMVEDIPAVRKEIQDSLDRLAERRK